MENNVDVSVNQTDEFKQWVKGVLNDAAVKNVSITFTKADGTPRTMLCTTRESLIPTDKAPKGTGRETADTVQKAFDLEKQEWRSFKWESVTNVSFDI